MLLSIMFFVLRHLLDAVAPSGRSHVAQEAERLVLRHKVLSRGARQPLFRGGTAVTGLVPAAGTGRKGRKLSARSFRYKPRTPSERERDPTPMAAESDTLTSSRTSCRGSRRRRH